MSNPYIDTDDDPLVFDGISSFSGGEDSQGDPLLIEPNASSELINCMLTRTGGTETRKGSLKLGLTIAAGKVQGLSELDTPLIEKLLAACNGGMYEFDGSIWTPALGYAPSTASVPVEIVQGINRLYLTDGIQNLHEWNGTTFTDLGTGSPAPPIVKYLIWHTSRMFGAGNILENDTIWVSDFLDAGSLAWDYSTRSFRVGGGEGDAITAIASWHGFKLLAFKNNSFYVVDADPQLDVANWVIERVSDNIGCVSHRSVAMVGNDAYFLSRDGVRSVIRTTTDNQNEVSLPLSFPIQPIIDRINWTYADKSTAIPFDNKYMLCVPLDGATEPNAILVFDTRFQRWSGRWLGMNATCFLISKLGNIKRCLFGSTDGRVIRWLHDADDTLDSTYQDDGVDIATSVKTRAFRFNEPIALKNGWNILMEFFKSRAKANAFAILDQGEDEPIASNFDTEEIENQLPLPQLPFNLATIKNNSRRAFDLADHRSFLEIQFKITSNSKKLSLKSMAASAFVNTVEYER
jgi:hypothetical protein